jgi:membrane protein insertase Oxa1/YidC/SpoIIIJ
MGEKESSPMIDAFFIGFLIGIVMYSILANTWGIFTLIPLFMIYGLLKKSKKDELTEKRD